MMSSATARTLRLQAADTDDVLDGLRATHKRLPCRLLYDAAGTDMFEAISRLDAYYPTRLETDLLERFAPQISQHVGECARVVEPGSGETVKTKLLLGALDKPASYVPIDVAPEQLERTTWIVRRAFPKLEVQALHADYQVPFTLPAPQHPWKKTLVFFPGSAIGNFEPGEARELLAMFGAAAGKDRLLLLGADATRDPELLERAYDDELGANAKFNKNVLAHVNRTRNATFDAHQFEHRAVWNGHASRVEMQLVSKTQQIVRVDGVAIPFAPGEPIVTEHCYKHTPAALQALLGAAGWRPRQVFTGSEAPYRLWLCEPTR